MSARTAVGSMSNKSIGQIEGRVQDELAPFGLVPLGWFEEEAGQTALLIGNIGSGLWPSFSNSLEYRDGGSDPLDRWTKRIIDRIADDLKAEARYPFGTHLWPFQAYARQATGMKQSPTGLLIHPEYGLWMAFRGVLVFSDIAERPPHTPTLAYPCETCVDRPCLNTCPVDAFSEKSFDYSSCRQFVRSPSGQECQQSGCLARRGCPVGSKHAYDEKHQQFHMAAFV